MKLASLNHLNMLEPTALHLGGSAFAGYQAFSTPRPAPLGSLVQQHSAPVPCNEEDAGDDEEVQVNNRVAGGAGKRLSVEDLQVCGSPQILVWHGFKFHLCSIAVGTLCF